MRLSRPSRAAPRRSGAIPGCAGGASPSSGSLSRRRRPSPRAATAAPVERPRLCRRMALRLSMSAGALRNVPTREIARACSWLSPKDLASLVSLSCWRLTADPHGLGALTVSLSVAENCRTLGASWVPPPKQNVLQPLAVIAEADRAVGDGARCLAALDALRRDCGRAHRTARDAPSTFKRTLFGRQAPSNEDASDDLGRAQPRGGRRLCGNQRWARVDGVKAWSSLDAIEARPRPRLPRDAVCPRRGGRSLDSSSAGRGRPRGAETGLR